MSATHKLPVPRVRGWIRQTFLDDAAAQAIVSGRIFANMALPEAESPYIVYQLMSSESVSFIGGSRLWDNSLFLVKAVAKTPEYDSSILTPIVDRIDDLFHDATGEFDGVTIFTSQYERTIEYTDDEGYVHLGCEYRILPAHTR